MKDIILILILQLCYVPMLALRTISMVKKLTVLTAFFGFLESLIYVFGLAIVLSGDQSILSMLVYAIGFSLGLIVGIQVEKRIAIGYTSVLVNISRRNNEMISALREQGFGVTVFQGDGKDSPRYRLDILTKRSMEVKLMAIIDNFEPTAFVISYEPTRFQGGYLEVMMQNQHQKMLKNIMPSLAAETSKIRKKTTSWLKKTVDEISFELDAFLNHRKSEDEKDTNDSL